MQGSHQIVIKNKGVIEICCITCNAKTINCLESLEKRIENYPSMANMLLELAGINIKMHNNILPKYICKSCINKLKDAYAFVKLAQRVNKQFLAKLHEMTNDNVSNEQLQLKELQIKEETLTEELDLEILDELNAVLNDLENCDEIIIKQEEFISLKGQDESSSFSTSFDKVDSITIDESNFSCDNSRNEMNCINDTESTNSNKISDSQTKSPNHSVHSVEKPTSNDGPFYCNLCGKAFVNYKNISRHERKHFADRDIECKYCDFKFYRKDTYDAHLKTHIKNGTDKAKSFDKSSDKQDTIQLNSDHSKDSEVSENETKCRSSKLLSNKKLQTNDVFCCKICGKVFTYKRNVVRHEESHSEPNFECKHCGRKFHRKDSLKAHLKTHQKKNH